MKTWRSDVTAAAVSIAVLVVLVGMVIGYSGGLTARTAAPAILPSGQAHLPEPGGSVRSFGLTAASATLELKAGLEVPVWAYNGTVPGPELRVKVGDLVRVQFTNNLPAGTTIHWHGLSVPNGQDGVAGVTQDIVPSGGSASYAFVATTAGTYWYHSHQDSAAQEDRGLYGALIVEPRDGTPAPTLDQTLIYDEWSLGSAQATPPPGDDATMVSYGTYSVNGRTGDGIQPIRFQPGMTVRLRFINAGFLTHYIHVHGVSFRIVASDGHELVGGPPTEQAVAIGAGERIDVEFTAPASAVWVQAHDPSAPAAQIGVHLLPVGSPMPPQMPGQNESVSGQVLDLLNYPARAEAPIWPARGKANKSFTLTLNETMGAMPDQRFGMPGMAGMGTQYMINGKSFPNTQQLEVTQADLVSLTIVNRGRLEHPIHLHGGAFQILAVDGQPVQSQLVKDTVLVDPGRSITIGFRADNPGWWMLHCHELHHASGGMDALVYYSGSGRLATLGGRYQNSPE
jgi:FtsP/CotA-like multicopper oxidase with cupredoxin domain